MIKLFLNGPALSRNDDLGPILHFTAGIIYALALVSAGAALPAESENKRFLLTSLMRGQL